MKLRELFMEWVVPVVAAVIIATLVHKFLFFMVRVPSESMYPTIKIGDRIVSTRIYDRSKLKRGDIVVFYSNELKDTLIKRLVGLPGDVVEVKAGEQVYINGGKYEENYVVYKEDLKGTFKVPQDSYLFMGDNRAQSFDSRKWNNPYIEGKYIQGKAQFIVYPFKRFGKFVIGREALDH